MIASEGPSSRGFFFPASSHVHSTRVFGRSYWIPRRKVLAIAATALCAAVLVASVHRLERDFSVGNLLEFGSFFFMSCFLACGLLTELRRRTLIRQGPRIKCTIDWNRATGDLYLGELSIAGETRLRLELENLGSPKRLIRPELRLEAQSGETLFRQSMHAVPSPHRRGGIFTERADPELEAVDVELDGDESLGLYACLPADSDAGRTMLTISRLL